MPRSEHLTEDQRQTYWSQGFVLLPGLIGADLLAGFNQRFVDLVNGTVPLPDGMKIMQDVMVVKGAVAPETPAHGVNKLLCLEEDPLLFDFARRPELIGAVQSLLGNELYSLSSNVFNKPPGVDGRHPLHQDLRYFKLRPADQIVGVWTALLPAPREAGCLAVIPGSHKQDLLAHESPDWDYVNYGFFGLNEVNVEARVHVEMAPGDTLLFHPLLIHGSGRNRSTDFRRAISVHYAAGSCEAGGKDWRQNPFTRRIV